MYSNKKPYQTRTVAARITLLYSAVCACFCVVLFTVVSSKMSHNAARRIDQEIEVELREFAEIYKQDGQPGLEIEFVREVESNGAKKMFCRLLSAEQTPLISSNISGWNGLEDKLKRLPEPLDNAPALYTLYPKNSSLNVRIGTVRMNDGQFLQLGINQHSDNRFYRKIQRVLIASSLVLLGLSTLFGWLIARKAMAGVQRVTHAVSLIQKGRLNQQVPYGHEGREIDELTGAFNQMLERIESLVNELKEVSDNVAHDLRSPITRMRGIAETTLTGPQDLAFYREMGLTVIEESDRLTQMINTTLEIAQAESGLLNISCAPLEFGSLLSNAADLFAPVAEEKQITLAFQPPEDPIILYGDKTRLQRVIANLLDNAIKFTPAGGIVTIDVLAETQRVRLDISDTGPGIEPADVYRIFDRFCRGEKSRSSQGNGLGLSLAKTIVKAHKGTINAANRADRGFVVSVVLPCNPETV